MMFLLGVFVGGFSAVILIGIMGVPSYQNHREEVHEAFLSGVETGKRLRDEQIWERPTQ
jgi:hypothetical protein